MHGPLPFPAFTLRRIASVALACCVAAPVLAAQFNRDRAADLLQRERTPEEYRLRVSLLDTTRPGAIAETRGIVLGSGADRERNFDVRTADFNADGRSDILTRDLATDAVKIRLLDGIYIVAQRTVGELATLGGETLVTTADFDGDGRSDLLFRDERTGQWTTALMDGTEVRADASGLTSIADTAALEWVSSADFNADGRADVLLRNRSTLAWQLYLMNGSTASVALAAAELPRDPDWQLQAVVDLDRDARADLLFRSRATGKWYCYFMDGGRVLPSSGPASIYSNPAYLLEGIGDLNGDGYPDVLQRRANNGRWYVNYMMERWRLAESAFVDLEPQPRWHVAQIRDFTGDGVDEALVTDASANLRLVGLANPWRPVVRSLDATNPPGNSIVCDPPNYYQFGTPRKPVDAAADSAFLYWTIPLTRTNGETLCTDELAGYSVRIDGRNTGTTHIDVHAARTDTRLLQDLAPDSYTFRIHALDTHGAPSPTSATVARSIR